MTSNKKSTEIDEKDKEDQTESKTSKLVRPEIGDNLTDAYRQLIERCWSSEPDDRPTFDEIVNVLKTDSRFITDKVDSARYFEYIESIENSNIEFLSGQKVFQQDELIKSKGNINEKEFIVNEIEESENETIVSTITANIGNDNSSNIENQQEEEF